MRKATVHGRRDARARIDPTSSRGGMAAFEAAGRRAMAAGDFAAAIDAYARAVAAGSTSPDVSNDLGVLLAQRGQLATAVVHLETALLVAPGRSDVRGNLVHALDDLAAAAAREGRLADAAACFTRLSMLDPANAAHHANAGAVWLSAGAPERALPSWQRARQLAPGDARVRFGLGSTLLALDQSDSEAELERAVELAPRHADALVNLALVWNRRGRLEDARGLLERALAVDPSHAEAHCNLAGILREQGELGASLEHYRRASALRPASSLIASSALLALQGDSAVDAVELLAAHRAWNDRFAASVDPGPRVFAGRDRDPERRLRIAYVSADLRSHSVASFVEPLLLAHDRAAVEVLCYSDGAPDAVTARLRVAADGWCDSRKLSDAALAAQIEADQVDVLVDLNGHTSGNRLLSFARRPAPVQVTYCGYPGTTGVRAIGWRLTDARADPPGAADEGATEALWRLPNGFLCFQPDPAAGEVGPLPATERGHVTFASFNNLAKITDEVLALWACLLREVEGAHLLLKSRALSDPGPAARVRARLAAEGIDPARVAVASYAPTPVAHLGLYREVDVALDSHPYNGTTTTCEALWMGVPVVTLVGPTHAGRVGASLLSRVGLDALVTSSRQEYVSAAVKLARDLPELAHLRAGLRDRVARSPLVAREAFARDVEDAFRQMWRLWCARPEGA